MIERATRVYGRHRALCEDLHSVSVLSPVDLLVQADIELDDAADPSDTLANVLFALALTMAPEPKRTSLDDQLTARASTADIFTGPLMLRGFIASDQLTSLATQLPVDQLAQVLAKRRGLLSVDKLRVRLLKEASTFRPRTFEPSTFEPNTVEPNIFVRGETVPIPAGSILRLRDTSRAGRFTINLIRNDTRCQPDAGRVRRRLVRLWARQRRTYPLRTEYAAQYAAPKGTYWDLAAYTSVQNQFPAVYGIGTAGLPPGASKPRQGRARQLQGYLMPFD